MPIDMEESVIQALHPKLGSAPFEIIQPTATARIQNWLASSIGTAQMVTLSPLSLCLTLLAIPLVVLFFYKKRKNGH